MISDAARAPIRTDIVLVGGGHAQVQVMTAFAMAPLPGVRLTLITRDLDTPYSGMLPGHLAGIYTREDIHIDLARLASATGTRLIQAEAIGLDRAAKQVLLKDRPPIAYDLVSLNLGINPDLSGIAGGAVHAIAVKPISRFLDRWQAVLARALDPDGPRRFLVIGGGAAGVELALAIRARLSRDAPNVGIDPAAFVVTLVGAGQLVATLNSRARSLTKAALTARGITVVTDTRVVALSAAGAQTADGRMIDADAVLVSTQARAPAWLAETGLALAADGSLLVRDSLQTLDDDNVFAVGDCAVMRDHPREKAGVFAVRQGPILADNLRRRALGQSLASYAPQRRFLTLLATGDGSAIGARGQWFAVTGNWVWRWKDRIDRRFMAMFADFGRQAPQTPDEDGLVAMPCGGCAAKIGPDPLARALRRLPMPAPDPSLLIGLDQPDDAAVIRRGHGKAEVLTIDQIKAFIGDPYRFGEIAAQHALNDVLAMGGTPRYALALAQVPYGPAAKIGEDLMQLLAGARAALDRESVTLVGGHSATGDALALGLALSGQAEASTLRRKGGAQPDDVLVLTKPIGTGVIFAADMRAVAPAPAIAAAISQMRQSSTVAARILIDHDVRALTDVSGFGLIGHLAEMLSASAVDAIIDPVAVPIIPGARALAAAGYASSLLAQTRVVLTRMPDLRALDQSTTTLLLDPQTSGGFLAALAPDVADRALAALRSAGYAAAAIGRVTPSAQPADAGRITLAPALFTAG